MNHIAIIRVLSYMGFVLSLSMMLPLLMALFNGESQQVMAFGLVGVLTLLMSCVILLMTSPAQRPGRVPDALAVAIIWCIGAPLPAAIPFVFGTAETSFFAGLHEAVSCLTTTGHSMIDLADNPWPKSLLLWRGILHVIGMMFSLTVAASVFAALGLGGPGIHRSFLFTVPKGSFFDALPRVLRTVFILCACLILAVFSGLVFNGVEAGQALSLAVSISSTGLVDPNGYEGVVLALLPSLVVFLGLLLATAGLSVMINLRPKHFLHAEIDPELFLLIGLIVFVGGLAFAGGLRLVPSFGWALSALSTSGVPIGVSSAEARAILPLPLLIMPALVGGSALSTAGGIKLARIIILIRRAGQEFARLGFKHSIVSLRFRERQQEEKAVLGIWVYLIAYIGATTLIFAILSFLGDEFPRAIKDSAGAISNSGWLIAEKTGATGGYHVFMSLAMILGRLEILAILPALSLNFWRK